MNGTPPVTSFVSYARADQLAVQELVQRLGNFDHECFIDAQLRGGQQWWDVLLEQIRDCPILIFALSPDSAQSRACRRELKYAQALGKHIVPVMIRDTPITMAPDSLVETQAVNFVDPGDAAMSELDNILDALEEIPAPLPDPLPDTPDAPVADLSEQRALADQDVISKEEQNEILADLSMLVRRPDDRNEVVGVLETLDQRDDLVGTVENAVRDLLARYRLPPTDRDSRRMLKSLVSALSDKKCIPILGSGMNDWLVGSRRELARDWAQDNDCPLDLGPRDGLPQAAQYISVTETTEMMRDSLADFYRARLKKRFPAIVERTVEGPGPRRIDDVVHAVWEAEAGAMPAEPHTVLAQLPCPIYVSAEPTTLLPAALRAVGREPREDFCRWNHDREEDWPDSPFKNGSYEPSLDEPLVFHIFGTLAYPDSIVVTEDDYFDFLTAVSETDDLIPGAVTGEIAESSLLFLGFGLQDWDVRILLRALVNREIAKSLGKKFRHVAAEVEHTGGNAPGEETREYLEEYFSARAPKLDIFWASVEGFCEGLANAWSDKSAEEAE